MFGRDESKTQADTASNRGYSNESQGIKAQKWKELARQYHELRMTRARASNKMTGDFDGTTYLIFGLAAATGKVLTQAKRLFGGDIDSNRGEYADKLASVRIYLEQLAREAEIDLDYACLVHMKNVLERLDK